MKGNRMDGGTWTRRDVFRVGSMATAAGVIGGVDAIEGATESQGRQRLQRLQKDRRSTRASAFVRSST